MKKMKLSKFESAIEKDILKYKPASSKEREEIENIIKKVNEKKNISLRVNGQDLDLLKLRAEKEGILYQTFISSVLHKFVTDQLVDQKNILKSIQLLKFNSQ
ncbi:MAG: antitoxin [Candidatus Omnitrophota bacterium]